MYRVCVRSVVGFCRVLGGGGGAGGFSRVLGGLGGFGVFWRGFEGCWGVWRGLGGGGGGGGGFAGFCFLLLLKFGEVLSGLLAGRFGVFGRVLWFGGVLGGRGGGVVWGVWGVLGCFAQLMRRRRHLGFLSLFRVCFGALKAALLSDFFAL